MKTDADLIRRVQAGDQQALASLYRRYLPAVWRYAWRRLDGDRHAVEDAVAETFLAAIGAMDGLDPGGGSFYAWLVGIARHKLADRARAVQRTRRAATVLAAGQGGRPEAIDPREAAEAAERRARVAVAVDQLDDQHRLVLEWKYVEGLPVRRMAECLGCSDKAIEGLLYRARRALRESLGDIAES